MGIPNQVAHRQAYRTQLAAGEVQQSPSRAHGDKGQQPAVMPLAAPRPAPKTVDGRSQSLAEQLGLVKTPKAMPEIPRALTPVSVTPPTEPTPAAPPEAADPLPQFETLIARDLAEPDVPQDAAMPPHVDDVQEFDEDADNVTLPPINTTPDETAPASDEPTLDLGGQAAEPERRPLI